jgi:hypothetical protein
MTDASERRRAAVQAKRYCAGELARIEFHREFGDTSDPEIDELVYLIDHESQGTGILPRSIDRIQIESLIGRL